MGIENTLVPWLGRTSKMIDNHVQELFCKKDICLTKIQWVFLKKVQEQNGVAQQELACLTGRDKTSLTRLVNTMEKKNLVARIPSKLDKRINNIHITKKGALLYNETLPIIEKFVAGLQKKYIIRRNNSNYKSDKKDPRKLTNKNQLKVAIATKL